MFQAVFMIAPIVLFLIATPSSIALEVGASGVLPVSQTKSKSYHSDGLFVGGDHRTTEYSVSRIRRAPNAGFERIVIDFDTFESGTAVPLTRPPYYQVAVEPEHQRISISLFGNVRVKVDPEETKAAFSKSKAIQRVDLFSRVLDDSWVFSFKLNHTYPVEVIELQNPTRVVLDLKLRKE